MQRTGRVERKTRETDIKIEIVLDGGGSSEVQTGLGFMDHMLTGFAKHGCIDLVVSARGDLEVDAHHTIEDLGLVLGQAVRQALGDKDGITRFGAACIPMDDALARVVLDFSGRAYLRYNVPIIGDTGGFSSCLFREFFLAVSNAGAFNLHIDLLAGAEIHHSFEAIFKAFGRAVREAAGLDAKMHGAPSTKGMLA